MTTNTFDAAAITCDVRVITLRMSGNDFNIVGSFASSVNILLLYRRQKRLSTNDHT